MFIINFIIISFIASFENEEDVRKIRVKVEKVAQHWNYCMRHFS